MTIQDLIQQMQGAGFQSINTYSDLLNIDQGQIMETMYSMYPDLDEGALTEQMFQPFSPSMYQSTLGKTYSPLMAGKGGSMLSEFIKAGSGQKAKQAAGGFAGTGGYDAFSKGIKDVYGKGMTDIIQERGRGISSGTSAMSDLISSWQQAASQIAV